MESIGEIIKRLKVQPRLYLICSCGNFEPGDRDPILWRSKCKNCGRDVKDVDNVDKDDRSVP